MDAHALTTMVNNSGELREGAAQQQHVAAPLFKPIVVVVVFFLEQHGDTPNTLIESKSPPSATKTVISANLYLPNQSIGFT